MKVYTTSTSQYIYIYVQGFIHAPWCGSAGRLGVSGVVTILLCIVSVAVYDCCRLVDYDAEYI